MIGDDDYLLISSIQHFSFCKRQWALIHIEKLWVENILTAQGRLVHSKVDNPENDEWRNETHTSRSVPVVSHSLRIYGVADIVEFDYKKKYREMICYPVEYKRGTIKIENYDRLQLCAIAKCLEEMLNLSIDKGYIYYDQIRRRETVFFDEELRNELSSVLSDMKIMYENKTTPSEKYTRKCKRCSLLEVCMPKTINKNVSKYIENIIYGDLDEKVT